MIKTYKEYINLEELTVEDLLNLETLLFDAEDFIEYLLDVIGDSGTQTAFIMNMEHLKPNTSKTFFEWFQIWAAWMEFSDEEVCRAMYL